MATLEAARRVIAATETKAEQVGRQMNVAVVNSGENLVAHVPRVGASGAV